MEKKYISHINFADENSLAIIATWLKEIDIWPLFNSIKEGLSSDIHEELSNKLDKISNKFYNYLSKTGYELDEEMTISLIDLETFQFNIHLDKKNKDIGLKLAFGNVIDFPDELILNENQKETRYSVYYVNGESCLSKTTEDVKTTNGLYSCFFFKNSLQSLSLLTDNTFLRLFFLLHPEQMKNSDNVIEYVKNLSFPINIDEVFDNIYKIAELDKGCISDYDELLLQCYKGSDDDKVLTDSIIYKNGQRVEYINSSLTYNLETNKQEKADYLINHGLDLNYADSNDQRFWDYVWEEDEKKTHRR